MRDLTNEQAAIRDLTRDFVRKEIAPFAAEWDRTGTVPLDTLRKAGALGLFGLAVPAEWGGGGADFAAYILMTEELAYGDAGVCNMISATNAFAWKVRDHGTPAQKERFLRPVATGDALACLMYTEPQAVTDPAAGKRGISAFLVRTDVPGYRVVRVEDKLGHRTNDTCQIVLEDLEVSADDTLGPPGQGPKIALEYLDAGRIGVAAQSVGVARAALDAALRYARERETFGKKLIEHQAIAFSLAEMATEVEVARHMCLH